MAHSKIQSSSSLIGDVAVVVLPLPAHGHLNQSLHLSGLLADRGLDVHYVSSASHIRQVVDRCGGADRHPRMKLHAFTIPSFLSPPPDRHGDVKFLAHLQPAFDAAAAHMSGPLSHLLRSLTSSHRRVIIVHDSLMSFALSLAEPFSNVDTYVLHTVSALCLLNHFSQSSGNNNSFNFCTSSPSYPSVELSKILIEDCFAKEFLDFISRNHKRDVGVSGRLLNTFPLIERDFVELLRQEPSMKNQKFFTVGPLNPITQLAEESGSSNRHDCLRWLDRQLPDSVVFVSFGTTSVLSDEQIKELAIGLAASKQKFLWLLRDADRADIYAQSNVEYQEKKLPLPSNYEEMVQGVGKVVREWAPQLEILAHRSIGAFMSHCGWNSCMESISNGVAILAWPLHSDQPANAVLVTKVLGIGVFIREWEKKNELLRANAIAGAVERMMVSEEGREVRSRARVLGDEVRKGMDVGGGNKQGLDTFVAHITR